MRRISRYARPGGWVAFAILLALITPLAPVAAGEEAIEIPQDRNGLPLWIPAQYSDSPVRLELSGPDELRRLLAAVPLASFNREQIIPRSGETGLTFEPRVTADELAALRRGGWNVTELPDREQQVRREIERAWAAAHDKSGARLLEKSLDYYPTHAQIGALFAQLAVDHPSRCRTFTWGASVQGRELWGLVVSSDVNATTAEPEVRLSSTMHGNEPVDMVMLINLAQDLLTNYGVAGHEDVTDLVDNTEIHIMPLYNPDGYVAGTRENANGRDLNRNFPEPAGTYPVQEIETVNFMSHALDRYFVTSQNGHGGALVVNYPWDYTHDLTPDNAAIILLSLEYSTWNLPMYNSSQFTDGITNGADWYVTYGCLQDWSYYATGCIDLTVEVGVVKWPPTNQLDDFWSENRESLLHFVKAARYGVNGVVTDAVSGFPLDAVVTVAGNTQSVVTDPEHGDYYKLLETGTFDLTFSAPGYLDSTVTGVSTTWGTPTVLDVALWSEASAVFGVPVARPVLSVQPNPFNPRTELRFNLPSGCAVDLVVHDLRGHVVRRLLHERLAAGDHVQAWDGCADDGRAVASGIYVARLEAAGRRTAVKLVLAR